MIIKVTASSKFCHNISIPDGQFIVTTWDVNLLMSSISSSYCAQDSSQDLLTARNQSIHPAPVSPRPLLDFCHVIRKHDLPQNAKTTIAVDLILIWTSPRQSPSQKSKPKSNPKKGKKEFGLWAALKSHGPPNHPTHPITFKHEGGVPLESGLNFYELHFNKSIKLKRAMKRFSFWILILTLFPLDVSLYIFFLYLNSKSTKLFLKIKIFIIC